MHHTQILFNSCYPATFWLLLAFCVSLPKERECSDHRDMRVLIPEMIMSSYKLTDGYLSAPQIKLTTSYPTLDVRGSSTTLLYSKSLTLPTLLLRLDPDLEPWNGASPGGSMFLQIDPCWPTFGLPAQVPQHFKLSKWVVVSTKS